MNREEKIKELERELADEKYALKVEKEKEALEKKAENYWKKNSNVPMSSRFEDEYRTVKNNFIKAFSASDEGWNQSQLEQADERYIELIKEELDSIKRIYDETLEIYEENKNV